MTREELIASQIAERSECLRRILSSTSRKKIIIAGPGAGKTYTFSKIFEQSIDGDKVAITFIRKLTQDMQDSFGTVAEVRTFHAFCVKYLHKIYGKYDIRPHLSAVITNDAKFLRNRLSNFDNKFGRLEEGPEIDFYLRQGDYYGVSCFNDSVYRLLKYVQNNPEYLPDFGYIVVDEYQDFNRLEVEFLKELESKGPILIVGDDDQAVYSSRNSSPEFLRVKFSSGEYESFPLPFCSRCTEPIVKATNSLILKAQEHRLLQGRISKRFEYFVPAKEEDTQRNPFISFAKCTTGKMVAKYIRKEISQIRPEDVAESYAKRYPTALIIGPKQYLNLIAQDLKKSVLAHEYEQKDDIAYSLIDGYKELINNPESNFGWRIISEFLGGRSLVKKVVGGASTGHLAADIVGASFRDDQLRVLRLLKNVQSGENLKSNDIEFIQSLLGDYFEEVYNHYLPVDQDEGILVHDTTMPSILLKSFVGSKGLSAGHVFIVGMNNGEMPKNPDAITNIEVCQFLVAITRTIKKCHLLSNKWYLSPLDAKGSYLPAFQQSRLISWLPLEVIDNRGDIKADDLK